jgi:Ca2+-binding EF-hand superfamily protein
MKILGLNEMSFKTDFKTFVMMLSKEMKALQDIDSELSNLFSFIDVTNSGLSFLIIIHNLFNFLSLSPLFSSLLLRCIVKA